MTQRRYKTSRRFRSDWAAGLPDTHAYWECIGDEYNAFSAESEPFMYRHVLRVLRELLPTTSGADLVDIGCGTGVLASQVLQEWPNVHVTGVDFADSLLAIAKESRPHERVNYEHADIQKRNPDPHLDSAFDLAICVQVLMNVKDLASAYHWIRHAVRPGGHIVATVVHPFRVYSDVSRCIDLPAYEEVFPYEVILERMNGTEPKRFSIPNFNHPMGEYLQKAHEEGLSVSAIEEITVLDDDSGSGFPDYLLLTLSRLGNMRQNRELTRDNVRCISRLREISL